MSAGWIVAGILAWICLGLVSIMIWRIDADAEVDRDAARWRAIEPYLIAEGDGDGDGSWTELRLHERLTGVDAVEILGVFRNDAGEAVDLLAAGGAQTATEAHRRSEYAHA